ncbi:nucleotidyltransferase family protein [Loktanella sp. Alg231-35]|uniref:nucleotidyltransferase family protein n=1 Tax=Loktanella sp. Alg231-35 TaxID=1922220 RepID=UPI000D54CA31|nr:nucleotidyltransferase family protein [Loktanella sp. Alg231-35]
MIPILILAAGQSTRMRGADKLLADVGGIPLLRKQVQMALEVSTDVFVALHHHAASRQAVLDDLPATPILVDEAAEGMSGTMRGAVRQLPDGQSFMMVLGDLVALEVSDLQAILQAHDDHPDHLIWRGATTDGKAGHPIVFDASLRPGFENLRGDGGGEALVKPLQAQTCLVPLPDNRARFDLDTPEDWAAWLSFTSA